MGIIKIYEVKTRAAANAKSLLSKDSNYFYWNDARFNNDGPGDIVFVVNKTGKWGLFTAIDKVGISANLNRVNRTASFFDKNQQYTVADPAGQFDRFIRFKILQQVNIYNGWNWTTQLGIAEIYNLWIDYNYPIQQLQPHKKRLEKVRDLQRLFSKNGQPPQILEEIRGKLEILR